MIGMINNFVITFTWESRLKTVNSEDDNENVCESDAVFFSCHLKCTGSQHWIA